MVMMIEPLVNAWKHCKRNIIRRYNLYLTPWMENAGPKNGERLILKIIYCWYAVITKALTSASGSFYYTGNFIGDYVLSGGELAAAVLFGMPGPFNSRCAEWWNKCTPQILSGCLLVPPFYRPEEFRGWSAWVLMSGNHKLIEEWRHEQSVQRTKDRRPDIMDDVIYSWFIVAVNYEPWINN